MIDMNKIKLAIVVSEFNITITESLKKAAESHFEKEGGDLSNVKTYMVPGAFEIPGTVAQIMAMDGDYTTVKLKSGEMRKIFSSCKATIGEVGNSEHSLKSYGKAGAKRWLGIRPTVRGVAMNPIDHPHGGGEGKTSGGRDPVSPWGTPTKGYKTRSNKRTDNMIVRRRLNKKRK